MVFGQRRVRPRHDAARAQGLRLKFSVVTAVYNRRETVMDCVRSVLDQRRVDVEYVVMDGASTDGTLEVLRACADRIAVLRSQKDGGVYDALNKGFLAASGDVLGLMHSDDVFADEHALSHVGETFARTGADIVYGDLAYTRKDGRLLRYWRAGDFNPAKLRRGWMPPHPAFYAKRELYRRLGGFDTRLRIAADYDLMLRFLLSPGVKVAYVPRLTVKMRVGGMSNRGLKNILRKSREDYSVLRAHGLGGAGALLAKNFSKLPQFFRKPPPDAE